jgi:flagellar protein FlbT
MNITLRAGEKLYLNGAVIRVARKVVIELLNDATFLLQSHIMQASEATTPIRQIYFAIQVMFMDPNNAEPAIGVAKNMIAAAIQAYETPEIIAGLKSVAFFVESARYFEALKVVRSLYPAEQREMHPNVDVERVHAA